MKYIVSMNTKFGTVSAESKHPEDLDGSLQVLRKLARDLESGKKRSAAIKGPEKKQKITKTKSVAPASASKRIGHGETTLILKEIESKMLATDFFDKPETTGDVKSRLEHVTGKEFTSRKVSQALGILREKGSLKRAGKRNYYTYSK